MENDFEEIFVDAMEADVKRNAEAEVEDEKEEVVEEPTEAKATEETQEQPEQAVKPQIDPDQFKGYLEEREKRQKLEARLAELEAQRNQTSAQTPDILDDPEGYSKHVQTNAEQTALNNRLAMSKAMLERENPEEAQAVLEWVKGLDPNSPEYNAAINDPLPFLKAADLHKRQKFESEVSTEELEAFREWKAAQKTAPAAVPPKVLNTGTTPAKRETYITDKDVFNDVFST